MNENYSHNFQESIYIDCILELDDVTFEQASELRLLAPYGKANKEPLICSYAVSPEQLRVIPEKDTMIMKFMTRDSYRTVKGVCFGMISVFRERLSARYNDLTIEKICNGVLRGSDLKMDLVYAIDIDSYDGNKNVQMRIRDFRIY